MLIGLRVKGVRTVRESGCKGVGFRGLGSQGAFALSGLALYLNPFPRGNRLNFSTLNPEHMT